MAERGATCGTMILPHTRSKELAGHYDTAQSGILRTAQLT